MSSPYTIIIHRNIKCASTIPKELIWGKPNTVFECKNCIHYASIKNVLVGICYNCAEAYEFKYGHGFNKTKDYKNESLPNESLPNELLFGGINPADIDFSYLPNNEYTQVAIENEDAYSVYNLAKTPIKDLDLLFSKYIIPETDNYGWKEFKKIYSFPNDDNDEILYMLLIKIDELQTKFDQWNPEFLKRCAKIEKFFKRNQANNIHILDTDVDADADAMQERNELSIEIKEQCCYCKEYNIRKDLKKCSKCKEVKYCSINCQKRHWSDANNGHRQNCLRLSEAGSADVEESGEETGEDIIENIDIEDVD